MKNFLLSSLLLVFASSSFGEETQEVKLPGVLVERPDGSFMQFVFQEGISYCYFFDAEMKPVDPDVDRVAIRVDRFQPRVKRTYTVAIPFEGVKGLRAPVYIKPPHVFRLYLSFMRDGIDDPVEFYLIHYPEDLNATEPITVLESGDDKS